MTKKKIFMLFGGILLALVFAIVPSFAAVTASSAETASPADIPDASREISVTATKRLGGNVPFDSFAGTLGTLNYYRTNWSETKYFTISAANTLSVKADTTFSISMQYLPRRADNGGTFSASNMVEETILTNRAASDISDIKFDYYIDTNENDASNFSKNHGWGTYRFCLIVDGTPYYSNLYFVVPSPANKAPEIDKVILPSDFSTGNAYRFYIKNADDYKYVDESLIRWYVTGVGRDGTKYAWHKLDIGTPDFPEDEYRHWLVEAVSDRERGAKEFMFDPDVAGTWSVYCVVYNTTPSATESQDNGVYSTKDNAITVETGDVINTSYVIYIIIAAAVVLVGALIFVIAKSVKKEKVW